MGTPANAGQSNISTQGRRVLRILPNTTIGVVAPGESLISAEISGLYEVGLFRVSLSADAAVKFQVKVRDTGGTQSPSLTAQEGVALVANSLYTWYIPASPYATYDFSVDGAATILYFSLEEFEASQ